MKETNTTITTTRTTGTGETSVHIPVLLREVMEALDPKPGEFFIDGTLDGCGYACAILKRIAPSGAFLGVDWDTTAAWHACDCLATYESLGVRITLANGNFAHLSDIVNRRSLGLADGLVLDLGTSADQLERGGRGFSFLRDEPLLMTYSDEAMPVRELLRQLSEDELAAIIREFGEERYARAIAAAIKRAIRMRPLVTSGALAGVVTGAVPKAYERGRIHPATRTFQALRIYANRELENLEAVLAQVPRVLKPGGRVAVVSFHSLEDRIVKRRFRDLARAGAARLIAKKPITASAAERAANPRSRSAKLRALEIGNGH